MKIVVSVRRFLKGVDEPAWVELLNAEYRDYASWWRGTTVEEMLELEKNPSFDFEGRFVAELDGKPVGIMHVHVERAGEEKRGFIKDFCVLQTLRGSGVEEQLLEAAINEFRKHGMSRVRAWTGVERADRIRFLEKSGFKFSHRTLDMRIRLADMPFNIGENVEVAIRPLKTEVGGDIEALNWLVNECFKDDPLHVPETVEETRRSLLDNPILRWQEFFFAGLDNRNVGYIGVGIDERYNVQHDVKTGFVSGIGVLAAYRRRGIGTKLLLHVLKRLKAKGMASASLDTEDANPTRAVTLYEKVGFQVLQEYVTYAKDVARATS
ncbi:MAG TPA: GNAT family N-acetyltransferase [Candidatus Bathyarchaeia archaeon]|nr:GNAT family N-acetyltransferase [Candidatus Bathyarchaeia archaeon]